MKTASLIGVERIPYGCPVRAEGDGIAVATDPGSMVGISRRGGIGRDAWDIGDMVVFQTDGGIRTDLPCDFTLVLGGIERRFVRYEPHYFHLSKGKIVG